MHFLLHLQMEPGNLWILLKLSCVESHHDKLFGHARFELKFVRSNDAEGQVELYDLARVFGEFFEAIFNSLGLHLVL